MERGGHTSQGHPRDNALGEGMPKPTLRSFRTVRVCETAGETPDLGSKTKRSGHWTSQFWEQTHTLKATGALTDFHPITTPPRVMVNFSCHLSGLNHQGRESQLGTVWIGLTCECLGEEFTCPSLLTDVGRPAHCG